MCYLTFKLAKAMTFFFTKSCDLRMTLHVFLERLVSVPVSGVKEWT